MEHESLKPCPFCGGKVDIIKLNGGYEPERRDNYANFAISCAKCNLRFFTFVVSAIVTEEGDLYITNTKEDAIKRWNRRAADADS